MLTDANTVRRSSLLIALFAPSRICASPSFCVAQRRKREKRLEQSPATRPLSPRPDLSPDVPKPSARVRSRFEERLQKLDVDLQMPIVMFHRTAVMLHRVDVSIHRVVVMLLLANVRLQRSVVMPQLANVRIRRADVMLQSPIVMLQIAFVSMEMDGDCLKTGLVNP